MATVSSKYLVRNLFTPQQTQVLRAVFNLKNVRRMKGPAGTLQRFAADVAYTVHFAVRFHGHSTM